MKNYVTFDNCKREEYTLSEMQSMYANDTDLTTDYATFEDWLAEMLKFDIYYEVESNPIMRNVIKLLMVDDSNGSWDEILTIDDLVQSLKAAESSYDGEYYMDGQIYRDCLKMLGI